MSGLPIFVRNIEACRTLGRPIYTGYSPLNKESSLEKQQGPCQRDTTSSCGRYFRCHSEMNYLIKCYR
jgi:hypothetical protein